MVIFKKVISIIGINKIKQNLKKNSSILENTGEYQLPIESLMSDDFDNLYIAGRNLSADYLAQGALRVQANCFSMGEAVAKHIKTRIN